MVSRGVVLEDTFWRPWHRSLKSSKIALSSARGQHYFWTVEISLENVRNLAENQQRPFFWFPLVEIAGKKFFEDVFRLKKIFEDLFFEIARKNLRTFFFRRTLASLSLVLGLGLEIFLCPWQWWSRVLNFRVRVRVLILKNVLEYEYRKKVRVRVLLQVQQKKFLTCNSSKSVAKTYTNMFFQCVGRWEGAQLQATIFGQVTRKIIIIF